MLDTRWEKLNVLKIELDSKKKKLEDEQQSLEEQKKDIEDDKMMIDTEWGDIMANLLEKAALEKIIEEKDDELVTLKQQVPEKSFVKRKMCQEEPKDVSNKRSKLSDELMMMMNCRLFVGGSW